MRGTRERNGWIAIGLVLTMYSLLCLAPPAYAQERVDSLVSAEWLQRNIGRADLLLLDAQPPPLHKKAHIPGAVNVSVYSYAAREQSAAEMQRLMRSWGIGSDRTVVVYDQGGDWFATRLYFELHLNGLPAGKLLLLDGGLRRWQAIGGTVTADATPPPAAGSIEIANRRDAVLARLPAVLAASGDVAGHALIDALEPEYYYGPLTFFDRAGHIPNAALLPRPDFFNADGTFKSPEELRRMVAYHGIRAEQQIITYCGGGGAASVPWFALSVVAGYPRVGMYVGSTLDWLRDDRGLPFWTYAASTLMRDAAWVDASTGKMLRGFGLARVRVVDVRSADAYRQGHLPAAVNLPAEHFATQARDPQALTAALSQAGLKPTDEAVVVSIGGLNGDAALAFALLEQAGQQKVSLLMESVDDWGLRGRPLDKPSAPAEAKAAPAATSAAYRPARPRDAIVTEAHAPGGIYPTVLLASGRAPLQSTAPGTIHVPYTDLLNADGTPKAAKDIWTILAKAGLPRHARVVCVADDPREAAINYYILRLMGWPDVRVLVR